VTSWTRTIKGQRVWVVGASSGIGAELARRLRDRGARVAISGRREQLLEDVAQGSMTVAAVDVTNHDELLNATKQVATALGGLDTVI
jgi:NADP-dependent 3-hydroxy acid dehydrogenase YdfG